MAVADRPGSLVEHLGSQRAELVGQLLPGLREQAKLFSGLPALGVERRSQAGHPLGQRARIGLGGVALFARAFERPAAFVERGKAARKPAARAKRGDGPARGEDERRGKEQREGQDGRRPAGEHARNVDRHAGIVARARLTR